MLEFPVTSLSGLRRLLVIGCHPDDIEIGCGGTVLALARSFPTLAITWVVLAASDSVREAEALACANSFLAGLSPARVDVHRFRDGFLPYDGGAVKEVFEGLKEVEPDLVLCHSRDDLHQDHRLACELTWNTFRDHLVLEYEIPKFDGDLGRPNAFVPLDESIVDRKIELVREHYVSQRDKDWFDDRVFRGLMRIRGMESRSESGYAEAFTCRKLRFRV